MRISDQFPSDYLRAVDVEGELTLVMSGVEMQKLGDDNKPVLYFDGKEKGMVLNKTNAGTISELYGDDTDDWKGEAITLFSAMVSFQGKTVPSIRVKAPSKKRAAAATASGSQKKISAVTTDDEIPF
jgi:arabinogalactan endo-1,4-beta-galactosidase